MSEPSVVHNTFVVEKSYPKSPQAVFDAFADSEKKRVWFGQGEHHDLEEFRLDFRVGGSEDFRYRFNSTTPMAGLILVNRACFEDIVPGKRIVTSSTMSLGDRRISSSLTTFEFLETATGTDLVCTHQGAFYEGSDGPAMREAGWRTLLERLGPVLDR